MSLAALFAVLLAAITHAIWNLVAKTASRSTHFVWLYSMASLVLWTGPVVWVLARTPWPSGTQPWIALAATAVLHLAYSLSLQAGYRAGDLSLVYPIARGTGPLLSFAGAVFLLGEKPNWISIVGVLLVVGGIAFVADIARQRSHSPRAGIFWGLATGTCIAAYTLNDGWAVKYLALSPILVDYSGNLFRAVVLAPRAMMHPAQLRQEFRDFRRQALVVGALGPLGYILILWAMTVAPIGHVAPARELATLVGIYLGSRLLKEQVGWSRITGAVCIVLGVICLAAAPV